MTTRKADFYAVLGLPPEATQAEVSRAYRALLRRHHPDTRTGLDVSPPDRSDTALQQIFAAYAALGDPARRADYDQKRTRAAATARVPRAPQPPPTNHFTDNRTWIVAGPIRWRPDPYPCAR